MQQFQKYKAPKYPPIPFLIKDSTFFIHRPLVAVARSFGSFICIGNYFSDDNFTVLTHTALDDLFSDFSDRKRYSIMRDGSGKPLSATEQLKSLVSDAVRAGASPDAIRYLSDYHEFTKEEFNIMATKLAKKTAPKEKPAKAPKAAGTKSKGNPEALKKAREARAEAGPDVRKIKVIDKECPYREGSNRAASWAALKGAKTVEDYKTNGGAVKYISRWAAEGRIEVA